MLVTEVMGFSTLIFDCDGVILNSNAIKMEAYRRVTLPFGQPASSAMVDFHIENGGISRYAKFEYFVDFLLPTYVPDAIVRDRSEFLKSLLAEFSAEVKAGLLQCEVASCLMELRKAMPATRWLIVSGGDQVELREVAEQRGFAHFFDSGIYGSPKDKHKIVADLMKAGMIQRPALFLGDSRLDHEVAKAFDFDFVFLHDWTDFTDWQSYCKHNRIRFLPSLSDIVDIEKC